MENAVRPGGRTFTRLARHAVLIALALSPAALGQTWANVGTQFSLASNWTPSGVPATTATAIFPNATPLFQPNLTASGTLGGLNVLGPGWVFSGSRLAMNSSGGGISSSSGSPIGSLTFNNPVGIGANHTWSTSLNTTVNGLLDGGGGTGTTRQLTNSGTGLITIAGGLAIHGSGSTVSARTFSLEGTGQIVVNSAITDGLVIGNTGTLRVRTSGTVSLLGANTHSGGTVLGGLASTVGTVIFNSDNSFGASTGGIFVNDNSPGVFLQLQSGSGAVTIGSSRAITIGSGTGNRTLTFDVPNAADAIRVAGIIGETAAGFGVVAKAGPGTLVLANSNTYTNSTTVSAGTLALQTALANNIASSSSIRLAGATSMLDVTGVTAASGFQLGPTQFLVGIGTVNGRVTAPSGSTISPGVTGNLIATLSIQGGVNTLGGSGLTMDVNLTPTGSGDVADKLAMTDAAGTVTLGGALNLVQAGLTDNSTLVGDRTFTLVANAGSAAISTDFSNYPRGTGPGATATQFVGTGLLPFVLDYAGNTDGGSVANDVTITFLAPVPEPTTLALLAAAGSLTLRRRTTRR